MLSAYITELPFFFVANKEISPLRNHVLSNVKLNQLNIQKHMGGANTLISPLLLTSLSLVEGLLRCDGSALPPSGNSQLPQLPYLSSA